MMQYPSLLFLDNFSLGYYELACYYRPTSLQAENHTDLRGEEQVLTAFLQSMLREKSSSCTAE